MKPFNYIAAISLLLATSCKKDFLTRQPQTVVSTDQFYKTEADFEQANVGIYSPLRSLYGTGLADFGAWMLGEMRSDNTTFSYNSANRGYADREYVDLFIDDANGTGASTKYSNDYIIIGRANQVLNSIDQATFDSTKRNNYKGQALFLRAFAYFDLVQYFGKVPLVLKPVTNYEETSTLQSKVDEVYQQIIADATQAAKLLSTPDKVTKGYVANGAAYTLLGNVYIILQEYDKARAALLQVTGYSLQSDYSAIFLPGNKNNAESIFEVQYSNDPTAGTASNFAYNFLPILADPGVIAGFPSGSSNSYAGWNTPTIDLINAYEPGDKRLDASIGFYTGEGYTQRPYVRKYVHGADIAPNTNDDWPVYRYAEVLLFLAEAENELGNSGTALQYLNQVHAHPRTGLTDITETGKTALRDIIQQERQIEFAFENKRWLDLVRTGKAEETMNAQGVKIKANPTAYYYPTGVNPASASYKVTTDRLLFPIPQREIRLNPKLVQNKGY